MGERIVGIDLGTTNSLISVWEGDRPKLIPNAQGKFLTPSIVSLDSSGHVVVGYPAIEQLETHNQLSLASFKRYMGTNKQLRLGEHTFRPEELSALVLKNLIRDAEAYLKTTITEAVITVPAYFNDKQRKATQLAGELAGIKVERLLNEPTAAALAYGLHNRDAETKFLIFDLGGGTFDVSIVEVFCGVIEVRSSAGDNRLGGEDFTDALETYIKIELSKRYNIDSSALQPETQTRWRHQIQMLLHELSDKEEGFFKVIYQNQQIEIPVSRHQFNALVIPLIQRIRTPLEKALRDARIRPEDLDLVILVGGATRMPLVGLEVAKMFGKFPQSILHPDEAVALGAGVQAALKERRQELRDVVITDVCPYSLGTDVLAGNYKNYTERSGRDVRFLPIIERNTTIPTSRVVRLHTAADNQTAMKIPVYQGESYNVEENVKIGEFSFPIPPRPAGEEKFDLRYTYDINGVLEVEATVLSTGKQRKLTISNQDHQLTEAEIAASIDKLELLKIHPRDQLENRQVMSELENLFNFFIGEERQEVAYIITSFLKALNTQEPALIKEARQEAIDFIEAYQSVFE
jgi:molecular chaperone HscC